MMSRKLILILCSASLAVWAADNAGVRGPVTGYVFDAHARAIRPMVGIAGSSYLGAPAVAALDNASVAPDGSSALVLQAGKLMLYTALGGSPAGVRVAGAIAGIDRFAWSPASNAAAVYSSGHRQAQIVSGLPAAPTVGTALDLSSTPGQVTALAFDGERILAGASDGDSGGVYSIAQQGGPRRIAMAVYPSAIALAGADLYFADRKTQQIWQVSNYAQQPAASVFASDNSVRLPVGMRISEDGARLYVANADSRELTVYDLASRAVLRSLPLNFAPATMENFGDPSVFALNSVARGNAPLYVLSDRGGDKQNIFFVPNPQTGTREPNRYHPAGRDQH